MLSLDLIVRCPVTCLDPCHAVAAECASGRALFLLVLHHLNIILWDVLVRLRQPVKHILADIALHRDLLATSRRLGHTASRRELLAKLLRNLLQIQPERLQPGDLGDEFPLVALDALDGNFGRRALLALARLGCFGFGGLLLRVFLGALLSVDGERREVRG